MKRVDWNSIPLGDSTKSLLSKEYTTKSIVLILPLITTWSAMAALVLPKYEIDFKVMDRSGSPIHQGSPYKTPYDLAPRNMAIRSNATELIELLRTAYGYEPSRVLCLGHIPMDVDTKNAVAVINAILDYNGLTRVEVESARFIEKGIIFTAPYKEDLRDFANNNIEAKDIAPGFLAQFIAEVFYPRMKVVGQKSRVTEAAFRVTPSPDYVYSSHDQKLYSRREITNEINVEVLWDSMQMELKRFGLAHHILDRESIKLLYPEQRVSDISVLADIQKKIVTAAQQYDRTYSDQRISRKYKQRIAGSDEIFLELTVPFPTKRTTWIELIPQEVKIEKTENWDSKKVSIGAKHHYLQLTPVVTEALNDMKLKSFNYIFRIE